MEFHSTWFGVPFSHRLRRQWHFPRIPQSPRMGWLDQVKENFQIRFIRFLVRIVIKWDFHCCPTVDYRWSVLMERELTYFHLNFRYSNHFRRTSIGWVCIYFSYCWILTNTLKVVKLKFAYFSSRNSFTKHNFMMLMFWACCVTRTTRSSHIAYIKSIRRYRRCRCRHVLAGENENFVIQKKFSVHWKLKIENAGMNNVDSN